MFGPKDLPIVVDLDGTLIFNDSSMVTLQRYLRSKPQGVFLLSLWWLRGHAFVKQELARRVDIDVNDFEYNTDLLEALKAEKKSGRQLSLATGADRLVAQEAVRHLDVFDEIYASDGRNNCVSFKKAAILNQRYGRKQYVYVGNSTQDYAVWADSAHAVAANAPAAVQKQLSRINVSQSVFRMNK